MMCAWGEFTIWLPGFICLICTTGPGQDNHSAAQVGAKTPCLIMSAFSAYEMSLSATLEPPNQTKLLIPNAVTAPMLNIPDAL